MTVSYPTKLLLAFRSGDRCAFPGCGGRLSVDGAVAEAVVVGEAAHIAGEKPDAARYDENMTEDERNGYSNLIYLCGDHHTRVDKQEADFPTTDLTHMKAEHERKVQDALEEAFAEIGFKELQAATEWLVEHLPADVSYDFTLTAPEAKLERNGLGQPSRYLIIHGLSRSREVRAYIEMAAQTDARFPDRLKAGFLAEYYKLINDGVEGDALFELMARFAQRGIDSEAQKAAGVALLAYLFEACEVFKK